jgi:hypothetical protein
MNRARFHQAERSKPSAGVLVEGFLLSGDMREDMFKVIVERPRRHKGGDAQAARWRDDIEGPQHLGMRAGYGYRALNENLNPLRRYLGSQVGRPWNKVYSEIAENIDRRNTVQQHIYQHIDDFIAIHVELREGGRLVDLTHHLYSDGNVTQGLYVDPRTGLIRVNKNYRSLRRRWQEREQAKQAEIDARRRVLDAKTQLLHLAGEWFEVKVAPLPRESVSTVFVNGQKKRSRKPEMRFDTVLKRTISGLDERDERIKLYGSDALYAVSKRQLSRRELRDHGLR